MHWCDNFTFESIDTLEALNILNNTLTLQVSNALTTQFNITNMESNLYQHPLKPIHKLLLDLAKTLNLTKLHNLNKASTLLNEINSNLENVDQTLKITLPNPTFTDIYLLTKKILNIIKKNSKKNLKKNINDKVEKLLNDPTFNSKIMFKCVKPKELKQSINCVVTNENNRPALITDPEKVKEAVFKHHNDFFQQALPQKDISKFLNFLPSLPECPPPTFHFNIVLQTLIHRNSTAPGTDGITYDFFKFCHINNINIFSIISHLYTQAFKLESILSNWNDGITTLIPKSETSQSLDNWRPITLLNTLYKGYTLILNSWLTDLLLKYTSFQMNNMDLSLTKVQFKLS